MGPIYSYFYTIGNFLVTVAGALRRCNKLPSTAGTNYAPLYSQPVRRKCLVRHFRQLLSFARRRARGRYADACGNVQAPRSRYKAHAYYIKQESRDRVPVSRSNSGIRVSNFFGRLSQINFEMFHKQSHFVIEVTLKKFLHQRNLCTYTTRLRNINIRKVSVCVGRNLQ